MSAEVLHIRTMTETRRLSDICMFCGDPDCYSKTHSDQADAAWLADYETILCDGWPARDGIVTPDRMNDNHLVAVIGMFNTEDDWGWLIARRTRLYAALIVEAQQRGIPVMGETK